MACSIRPDQIATWSLRLEQRSIQQAAPPELLADLVFSPHGDYYLGFLSGLIAHRLTDLHSQLTFVAMPESQKPRKTPANFKVAGLSPAIWPADWGAETERIRVFKGLKEFAYRSTLERTLVDGLLRPDLCAGIEIVVSAWANAGRRADVNWDSVAQIALRIGGATSRRTAFLLGMLGLDPVVEKHFAELDGRKTSTVFDRSKGFELDREEQVRDAKTGVIVNVPHTYLRGWIQGSEIG